MTSKGNENAASKIMFRLYGSKRTIIRHFVIKALTKYEGGEFYSTTLRAIFEHYHKISIGMYTHGSCFAPGKFDKYTTIGRYCSFASGCRVMNRNHPLEFKSMHAFFFNPALGYLKEDVIRYIPLSIGSDVWFGHNALILPNVKSIGNGAVVAAGAVVNKDVPPYAVVVGNPARVVRYRFSPNKIEELLATRWWDKSIEELKPQIREFLGPYEVHAGGEVS